MWAIADLLGIERRDKENRETYKQLKMGTSPSIDPERYPHGLPIRILQLYGKMPGRKDGIPTNEYSKRFDKSRWLFFVDAPFNISQMCCKVMKKSPVHSYNRQTGRHPMTAQMANESRLRTSNWLKNGCNGFEMVEPISNPLAFWTDQDILEYIKKYNIPICSVYGEIVEDLTGTDEVAGQMTISDLEGCEWASWYDAKRLPLKTTGCKRTGCMFCGYGCHMDKPGAGRFERMKETHPKQYDYIMRPKDQGGLNYKEIIDWINENGNLDIRY